MDTNIGKIVKKRYKIKKKISAGGMSNIYLVNDLIRKKLMVLKVLHQNFYSNEKTKKIFENEIKITAQLNHKNVVKIHDFFFMDDYWCLVLEYIEGISLREVLKEQQTFTPRKAINITIQILEALQYAQQKAIVHRDIKPENILIIKNQKVKILDFGVAQNKNFEKDIFQSKIIGSIKYISPEMIAQNLTTSKSDIYSVGIILFEMLAGEPPFLDKDGFNLIKKHLYTPIPRIKNFTPKIEQKLENIIIRATAKNPEERYSDIETILRDCQNCFKKESESVHPLFLKKEYFQGEIENISFAWKEKKKRNFFWLKKSFIYPLIFIEILLFLTFIISLVIKILKY